MANTFLDSLFGEQEGYIYSPVNTVEQRWEQYFFKWPQLSSQLDDHIERYNDRDVYLSPVLFTKREITPETFKGTYHLWTEFDKSLPTNAIPPTMRVQSSIEGREHWYWKLDKFTTDRIVVEDLTRRIAYHYGADLSAWDYQQVLRPPNTWNHKRNKPVTLIEQSLRTYTIDDFTKIPIPPVNTKVDIEIGTLPSKELILAKYKWGYDALDLLFKSVEQGNRSDALTRLAYECVEAGLSNEETYVLLEDRDRAWGKYVNRVDRQKRLESFISYVRAKKATSENLVLDTASIYKFHDFMHTTVRMNWVVQDLLPVAGSLVIFGKAGIGKSTFALRMGMDIALGKEKFLNWKIINRQRILFISLEMQHGELKQFFSDMQISEEEQQQLQEWLYIWPIGHAYPLDTPDQQIELLKYIDKHKIDTVIIDSLGLSMYGSVKDDDAVKRLNSFLNEDLRKERNCGYIFIHHPRKHGIEEGKKTIEQDDVYGSAYIVFNAQTIMLLTQKSGTVRLNVKMLKTRMIQGTKDFDVERTPDRGFKLIDRTSIESRQTTTDKTGNAPIFGKLLDI